MSERVVILTTDSDTHKLSQRHSSIAWRYAKQSYDQRLVFLVISLALGRSLV